MAVLAIIGFLVGLMALYIFIERLNEFTWSYYKYEFFRKGHLAQVIIAYWIIYFGDKLYSKALKAVSALFILIVGAAILAETKPVYVLNND